MNVAERDVELPDPCGLNLSARLASTDADIRRVLLLEAADFGEDYRALFIHAAEDAAPVVRLEAVKALEADADAGAVSALIVRLDDEDTAVAEAAAASLAELQDERAAPQLLAALAGASGFRLAALLGALRRLRQPAALAPALRASEADDARVRREAVGVLAYLRDEHGVGVLARRAMEDEDVPVRIAAVGALAFSASDTASDALQKALADPDWQVREAAATSLAKLARPRAAQGLIAALGDDFWQVRLKAAGALGKLGDVRAVAPLCAALAHPIPNLRKEAAAALGALGAKEALPALRALANDSDIEVRKSVARAIAAIEGAIERA